ncbi:MAG TPA: HesA/MoeB/ThiF family protein [Polyangia bacterium]|nr:HesA/MoeB/ThiF family protein [Polyangia bacterium]
MNAAAPRVLVVGAGGLGCPALLTLAPAIAARAGLLGVIDDDRVELSNLNRQILHRTEDVGRHKAISAKDALLRRHAQLRVDAIVARVDAANANDLVREWDVVVDGSDSFATKFLLNDACVRAATPLVHGGVVQLTGQLMSIVRDSACYRCLFEAPPPAGTAPSCAEAGVVGAFAGIIGALQAKEALAIVAGAPELAGTLLVVDGRSDERRRVRIRPRPGCAAHLREVA